MPIGPHPIRGHALVHEVGKSGLRPLVRQLCIVSLRTHRIGMPMHFQPQKPIPAQHASPPV